jgi:integrase
LTKVTNLNERALLRQPGRHRVSDHLFLKVLDPDRAYWVVRYSVGGVSRETSLGSAHKVTRADATGRYHAIMAEVNKGVDPVTRKRHAKAAVAAKGDVPTFGAMADQYIAAHESGWKNERHRDQWKMTLAVYAAPIRDMPVDQIDAKAVLKVLTPIWTSIPESAARLRGRIEVILASAQVAGHIDPNRPNPARWKNWLDHLLPKPGELTRGHHASMPYADVPMFMARLAETPGTAARALAFTILCCARTSETLDAQWDEISFDDAIWRVPASRMKMQKPHDVPLSDAAASILRAQEAKRGKSPFVFSARPRQPLSGMSMAMLLRRLGESVTVHGFRSSARSWMADQGVPFELAEAALAHTVGNGVVQAYQRSSMLERRRPVLAAWAKFISGSEDNVVALKGRVRTPHRRA